MTWHRADTMSSHLWIQMMITCIAEHMKPNLIASLHIVVKKNLQNAIWMHMSLLQTQKILPCTCSIFHAPPCNRNVYTYVHIFLCKKVVIECFIVNYGNGIWEMGLLPTVVSRPLLIWSVILVWFIQVSLKSKMTKAQNKVLKVTQDCPLYFLGQCLPKCHYNTIN